MAANNSKTVKSKNTKNTQGWVAQHSRNLVVIVFVLLFGGVGGYIIGNSHAASIHDCVQNDWQAGSSGVCVSDLQLVLNNWYSIDYHQILPSQRVDMPLTRDGVYGSRTTRGVLDFQKWNNSLGASPRHLTEDGAAGPQTWYELCWWGSNKTALYEYGFDDAGCSTYDKLYNQYEG